MSTRSNARDVAAYILDQGPRTALDLQKLVYFVQAWNLAWDGVALFEDHIEAWPMGPVTPNLWQEHRNQAVVDHVDGNPDNLSEEARATIDAVLSFYGHMGHSKLIDMTHQDKPWLDARGDLPPDARSRRQITEQSMRRFYTVQQVMGEPAPKRPPTRTVEASLTDTMAEADRQMAKWRTTLDWLAVR